jgi:hypothetical protein
MAILAMLLAGCGATTLRIAIAPTVDVAGGAAAAGGNVVGVMGSVAFGIGWPLDLQHRSQHFMQGLAWAGDGIDGYSGHQLQTAGVDLDYIGWLRQSLHVRAGSGFVFHNVVDGAGTKRYGFGGHIGVMPIVGGSDASWLVHHVVVGPELRADLLFSDDAGGMRAVLSLPLVVELDFLAAGD